MVFEYLKTEQFMDSIDIDDTGNCYLQAYNDEGFEWLLSIETDLGFSKIKEVGPFILDSNVLHSNFYYYQNYFEFKEKKINKVINDFINNPRKQITQIFIIDKETFNDKLSHVIL